MLARRFTIVCLLMTLFGMLFAILVAEASRAPLAGTSGPIVACACRRPAHLSRSREPEESRRHEPHRRQ